MRLALAVALLAWGGTAHAQVPTTRLGAVAGPRTNMGVLGNRYAIGYFVGIEAGLMPSWLGIVWSLSYSSFDSSDDRNVEATLELFDLDFALRARLAPRPDGLFFLWGQLGVDLQRSSIPLEPDLDTGHVGPTARVGVEWVLGRFIVSVGADYGLIVGGPSSLRLVVFAGVGD